MRSVIHNIRILLTDPENYDARSEAGVGVRHGRERHAEDRQGHGFSGASDPASARRLHQLQPRLGSGGHSSRSVPPYLQVRRGAVCTVCAECLGYCTQRQRRGDGCRRYRRAGRVHQGDWPADYLYRAWHPRRHRLPRRGGFYQHHRWLLQKVDARRDLRNFEGVPVSIRAFRSKTKHSLRCAPFLTFLPLAFGPKRDIIGQTNCGKGQ